LERNNEIAMDKRLLYFSDLIPSSSGKHSHASRRIEELYGSTCSFCGATATPELPVTRAHIVSGNSKLEYSEFGVGAGYVDNLDHKSERNFLSLCGTKGRHGTCHDAFDTYSIALLYNPLTSSYFLYCFNRNFEKYNELHRKHVSLQHQPYRRLLAWRARRCAQINPMCLGSSTEVEEFVQMCTFSVESKSVRSDSSDVS
jgi:hypothetical protein